jgi:hypothetical protein
VPFGLRLFRCCPSCIAICGSCRPVAQSTWLIVRAELAARPVHQRHLAVLGLKCGAWAQDSGSSQLNQRGCHCRPAGAQVAAICTQRRDEQQPYINSCWCAMLPCNIADSVPADGTYGCLIVSCSMCTDRLALI